MKKLASAFALIFVLASTAHAAIDSKTVAGMWMFDEGAGATAADGSANGNNAALTGAVTWGAGKFGKAVMFDGNAANYVAIPDSDSLDMTGEMTVMFWVNTSKVMVDMWADRQIVTGKHYTEYEVGIYTGGQLHTYTWGDNADGYDEGILTTFKGVHPDGDADWMANKWYHVAWTLKGKHEIAYINGIMMGEHDKASEGTKVGTHPVEVGRRTGGGLPVTGSVDELAMFKVALSEADIKMVAEKGLAVALGGTTPVEPGGKLATTWSKVKSR